MKSTKGKDILNQNRINESIKDSLLALADIIDTANVKSFYFVVNFEEYPSFVMYNSKPTEWLHLAKMVDLMALKMDNMLLDKINMKTEQIVKDLEKYGDDTDIDPHCFEEDVNDILQQDMDIAMNEYDDLQDDIRKDVKNKRKIQ